MAGQNCLTKYPAVGRSVSVPSLAPDPGVEAPAMEDYLEASMVEEGCWERAVVSAMMGFGWVEMMEVG